MAILPRNYIKETGWVHSDDTPYPSEIFSLPLNIHLRTSTLQRPSKQLNPSHASLFDLLPTDILMHIEIWVSGLEHRDKFNNVTV